MVTIGCHSHVALLLAADAADGMYLPVFLYDNTLVSTHHILQEGRLIAINVDFNVAMFVLFRELGAVAKCELRVLVIGRVIGKSRKKTRRPKDRELNPIALADELASFWFTLSKDCASLLVVAANLALSVRLLVISAPPRNPQGASSMICTVNSIFPFSPWQKIWPKHINAGKPRRYIAALAHVRIPTLSTCHNH